MVHQNNMTEQALSESVQMYLMSIARLRVNDAPVPLSRLAEELSVSSVSVNEMCRRLQDEGLVIYRPYKGALLTPKGERRAYGVLRKHRLWEVFMVERLGYAYEPAHEAACQLEHGTSDLLADRLDSYIGFPTVNPLGEPIPRADGALPERHLVPLAEISAGQCGHVISYGALNAASRSFLDEQGIRPGESLTVLATAAESVLVQVSQEQVSLARHLAEAILVQPDKVA